MWKLVYHKLPNADLFFVSGETGSPIRMRHGNILLIQYHVELYQFSDFYDHPFSK